MGFVRARRLSGVVAGALALAAALPASAQTSAASHRRELGEIKRELEAARRDIDEYKRQEQTLNKDLQRIESRTGDARRRLDELKRRAASAERKKQQLKSRLTALGQTAAFWKAALGDDLRRYAAALAARDDAYRASDLWGEGLRRAAMLEKVELLLGLQGVSRTTALAEAETRRNAQQLAQRSLQAQQEHKSTQLEYEKKRAAIAEAQEKVAAATARARELEENAKALTRLLRALREPRRSGAPARVAHWDVPPNSLLWPAQGSVLKPFGRQRNAELNTWIISQGILLETAQEASVAAVRSGKVIFTGPFRSYGQVMILDHGSNLFSIYGDLGAILKQKGADVQLGETIAKAGSAKGGSGTVYFELRRGTEALDPLVWLRKR
jgi:septal ring factor EnvC (AmiA/AmiB activator)